MAAAFAGQALVWLSRAMAPGDPARRAWRRATGLAAMALTAAYPLLRPRSAGPGHRPKHSS